MVSAVCNSDGDEERLSDENLSKSHNSDEGQEELAEEFLLGKGGTLQPRGGVGGNE